MWPVFLIIGEWIFVLTIFFLEVSGQQINENIQFLRAAGYCKALITLVKYMPQVRKAIPYPDHNLGLSKLQTQEYLWMVHH